MISQLERQHKIDQHLSAWAKKNSPPTWLASLVVGFFLILGVFPFSMGATPLIEIVGPPVMAASMVIGVMAANEKGL